MKKRLIALTLVLMTLVMLFTSCAGSSTSEFNVGVLKGPTGFGAISMIDKAEAKQTKNTYNFSIESAADVVTSALLSKELDIAFLPSNAAAMLYNKTEGQIRVISIAARGMLYVVSRDASVASLADLKDKKVVTSGAGSTAEYATSYVFTNNGLTPGQNVTLDYASEHSEAATKLLSGEYDIAILPEPFVTSVMMQDDTLKVAVDISAEWSKLNDSELCMAAIAVRADVLEENPAAIDTFLEEFTESAKFVAENPADAAQLIEKHDIMKAAAAEKAIPNCNIACITGEEMKKDLTGVYEVLFAANPKSIGGAMPGDDFYYIGK